MDNTNENANSSQSEVKIDLLKAEKIIQKKKSFLAKKRIIYAIIFLLILISGFSYKALTSNEGIFYNLKKMNFFNSLYQWIAPGDKILKGENEDRINVLLTGIGGAGHDGPNLTDTIILASLKPSTGQVAMVSIPRDLNVPFSEWEWRKINNINAFAEAKEPGTGARVLAEKVSGYFGIPIHYYIRIDFSGFKKLIDDLGGINICVDKEFTDNQYPTLDYKVQTIHFDAGCQKMNGETALEYVRSRHGNNGEGSDFARSKRQQKVLMAIKNEIFSFSTLISLNRVESILEAYNQNISTNFEIWELARGVNLANGITQDKIITKVLDDSPDSVLVSKIINGAYVLLPKKDDFSDIKEIINNAFGTSETASQGLLASQTDLSAQSDKVVVMESDSDLKNEPSKQVVANNNIKKSAVNRAAEKPVLVKVEILNGTKVEGLAMSTKQRLEKLDFQVVKIGNSKNQDSPTTEIYDFTSGKSNDSIEKIKQELGIEITVKPSLYIDGGEGPDLLLILGADWAGKVSP